MQQPHKNTINTPLSSGQILVFDETSSGRLR